MRKLDDWLKAWLEYSSPLESPERMRLWAGIAAISAALQRKTFTYVKAQRCYPNTYILLVGPPGVGKGNAMKELSAWLKDIKGIWISPDGLTRRSFFSALENAVCSTGDFTDGSDAIAALKTGQHHSLTAFIEELGVFLHAGDNDFIYALCHVYDTPPRFHYKTETAGENFVENVWFSMLSAVTPKGLKDIFTDQALELGISARTMIIYSEEKIDVEIFGQPESRDLQRKELQYDLNRIASIIGEYQFTEEAAAELVAWSKKGFPPIPKDPRFSHYNARRFVQLVKLCMICAAAKRQETVILPVDLFQAKSFLLEAERVMPQAVASIGANPYLAQQQQAIKLINQKYQVQMKGTSEAELRQKLSADLDPRYGDMILDDIGKARWVTVIGESPNRYYYPRGKGPMDEFTSKGQSPASSTPDNPQDQTDE